MVRVRGQMDRIKSDSSARETAVARPPADSGVTVDGAPYRARPSRRLSIGGSIMTRSDDLRSRVLTMLHFIEVPCPTATLVHLLAARDDLYVPELRLVALMREERRRYATDGDAGAPYIVPALYVPLLVPLGRTLTSTAWTDERRLVGYDTPRAGHLALLLALLDARRDARRTDPARAERYETAIHRLSHSLRDPMADPTRLQPVVIGRNAQRELRAIATRDHAARQQAADRLAAIVRAAGADARRIRWWGLSTTRVRMMLEG